MVDAPTRAQVVVIGGGVVGTSVAYHLTKLGLRDVLLLEQGQLSCGTTWHAAGLVGLLRATESGTRLVQYSARLYAELEAETGLATGYKQCGGVIVARTPQRMTHLRRTAATAAAFDLECALLAPGEVAERAPVLRTDDLAGGLWLPGDGTVNPTDLTLALARGARHGGATILERTRVLDVEVTGGRVTGVRTDQGQVETEVVVNCAGQWGKQVGALAGVNVPLHPCEHFYAVTEPFPGVPRDLPVLRDPDGYTYFKEEVGGLVVGAFEPHAKPWVSPEAIPHPFEFRLLEEDWDHFAPLMDSAVHRIPALQETGIRKLYNGPESFTPDNQFILGEAPEVRGFFVGAGFNSVGIASAGGAGRALAEWVVDGEPSTDLTGVDIRRFAPFQGDTRWLRDRVVEVLGLHYEVPWPNREMESARPLRTSPVYSRLQSANARFGSRMGWERANVFAPPGSAAVPEYSWDKPNWLPWSAEEQRSTRTGVTVFDQTSFTKLLLTGPDAREVLQWLCTADVDVPVGRAVYTGMLNPRGTYESDVTVTRTGGEEYLVVSSAATTERDKNHIRRHIGPDQQVGLADVTSRYAVLGVMGPRSRELLSRLTSADLSGDGFPFGTSRLVDLAAGQVRATRITYVGELGWELYVPVELAEAVYDALKDAGSSLGVRDGGYYAIESLRLEKGYRAFGRELTPAYGPVEAGLLFTCKLATGTGFVGRDAVERARAAGPTRRLVSLVAEDPEVMMWGGELILRDGAPAGQVTSAAWGETLGACVGLGYVGDRDGGRVDAAWVRAGRHEVDLAGTRVPVRVTTRAPYDPDNARVR